MLWGCISAKGHGNPIHVHGKMESTSCWLCWPKTFAPPSKILKPGLSFNYSTGQHQVHSHGGTMHVLPTRFQTEEQKGLSEELSKSQWPLVKSYRMTWNQHVQSFQIIQ